MELFSLFATIGLKDSEFNKGIDNALSKGESFGSKFGSVVAGIGKATVAGLGAAAAAFGTLAVKALNLGGELEQNLGGAEAVFANFADTVKTKGETAFKDMGLSMSDFLATANKMGALFQGSGFGIEESADLASEAMQRAADVASIMGLDTSAAMEAVAGAAKGNFTMMDNLGVAMNATTIEAYALSKGIDTSYNSMTNQEKIGLAMEMFLEKTAYAAGNYAKENETLAGSLGTAKAALSNFLSGANSDISTAQERFDALSESLFWGKEQMDLGGKYIAQYADMLKESGGAAKVAAELQKNYNLTNEETASIIERIGEAAKDTSSSKAMDDLVESFSNAADVILKNVTELLPRLSTGLTNVIQGLIPKIPPLLLELLPALITGATVLIEGLMSAMPELMAVVSDVMPMLVTAIITMLPMMLETGIKIIGELVFGIAEMLPELIPVAVDMILQLVETLIDNIDMLVDAAIAITIALAEGLINALPMLMEKAPVIIEKLMVALTENIPKLLLTAAEIIVSLVTGIIDNFPLLGQAAGEIISTMAAAFPQYMMAIIDTGKNIVTGIWEGISSAGEWLKEKVGGFFSGIVDGIKSALGIHSPSTVTAEIGQNMVAGVEQGLEPLSGVFSETTTDAMGELESWAADMKSLVTVEIPDAIQLIVTYFSELPDKLSNEYKRAIEVTKQWIVNLISTANTELPSFVTAVVSNVTPVVNEMHKIGAAMIEGFWSGVESKTGWFFGKLKSFVDQIVEEVKAGLDIKSPSRVMANIGMMTGEGFITGLLSMSGKISDTIDQVFGISELSGMSFGTGSGLAFAAPGGAQMGNTYKLYMQTVPQSPYEAMTAAQAIFEQARW